MTEDMIFPVVREGAIGASIVQTVDARELHGALGVGKDFSNWARRRIDQLGLEANIDFVRLEVVPRSGENLDESCSPKRASKWGGVNRVDAEWQRHSEEAAARLKAEGVGQ